MFGRKKNAMLGRSQCKDTDGSEMSYACGSTQCTGDWTHRTPADTSVSDAIFCFNNTLFWSWAKIVSKNSKYIFRVIHLSCRYGHMGFHGWDILIHCLSQAWHPRFTGENLEKNKFLYAHFADLAEKHACSPAQLALAWLLHQGNDVVPIPGMSSFSLNQLMCSLDFIFCNFSDVFGLTSREAKLSLYLSIQYAAVRVPILPRPY